MDYIVHGILQARILEWVVVPFSRGSNPGLLHCKWILYQLSHQRSPENGTDELICKVEIETHVENKYMDTKSGRKGWVNWEIGINIYTMEYYSAIKKNTFQSVLMRWMKLEPIIQSEVSQKEKHQYGILTNTYIWNLERW